MEQKKKPTDPRMPSRPTIFNKSFAWALYWFIPGVIMLICILTGETRPSGWNIFFTALFLLIAAFMFWSAYELYLKHLASYELAQKDLEAYLEIKERRENAKHLEENMRVAERKRAKEEKKRAEQEFRRHRAECRDAGIPCCPCCGSTGITTMARGYSVWSGFVGSGDPVNVCQACGHKFKPGS